MNKLLNLDESRKVNKCLGGAGQPVSDIAFTTKLLLRSNSLVVKAMSDKSVERRFDPS